MASKTLQVAALYPNGLTVNVYLASDWSAGTFPTYDVAPPGSAATSAVVSSGQLALTGLTASTEYVAGAQVGGHWRYVHFDTSVPTTPASSADVAAVSGDLTTHAALHKGVHGLPSSPTNGHGVVWNNSTQGWDDADLATQAELDTHAAVTTSVHGISDTAALATTSYVDSQVAAIPTKAAVKYATAAALPANARVGNVLTATGVGALSVDGASPAIGDRILVKNEATQANNGWYTVTVAGSGIAAWVLTRSSDADTSAEVVPGELTFVQSGTANGGTGWEMTSAGPITLNTTALTFAEFQGGGLVLGTTATTAARGDQAVDMQTAWRPYFSRAARWSGATVGTWIVGEAGIGPIISTGTNTAQGAFYFDPAAFAITGRTVKVRLTTMLLVNDTAPAINLQFSLYPVTAATGISTHMDVTLGAVVLQGTLITTPAANSINTEHSSAITAPSAGVFVLAMELSGTQATGNQLLSRSTLEVSTA